LGRWCGVEGGRVRSVAEARRALYTLRVLRTFCGAGQQQDGCRGTQAAQPSSAERTLRQQSGSISAAGVPTPALLKPTSSSALLRRLAALLSPRGLPAAAPALSAPHPLS